ncbi:cytochrome P450 [Rhodococcus sp. 27YEA15]|uniref:cytochrome P450 n=1 Tax=Rhodococcus sp. 27YEA15 TaxID=3156259 RepID=UPI003C7D6C48
MIEERAVASLVADPEVGRWGGLQYDHHSSKVKVAPFDLWSSLRRECPVLHSDNYGGFWFLSRYDDVKRVLTDFEDFSAAEGATIPRTPLAMLPLEADPPIQRQYRSILNPYLTPAEVLKYEGFARELISTKLASEVVDGRIDLAHFGETYAHTVTMRAVGFDVADLSRLSAWCEILFGPERDSEAGQQAGADVMGFFNTALDARIGQDSSSNLLTAIANAEIDGRPLDRQEQTSLVLLLVFGGFHTTGSALTSALVWLADHPGDVDKLRADPDLMPTAIEEFVRYSSPVSHMRRTTTRDVEFNGCPVSAGQAVQFGIASANHDETVFESPDQVLLDRHPNRHLGFGSGPHRCLGSHLGKLVVRIGLEEFLAAVDTFEIEDHEAMIYFASEGRSITQVFARVQERTS